MALKKSEVQILEGIMERVESLEGSLAHLAESGTTMIPKSPTTSSPNPSDSSLSEEDGAMSGEKPSEGEKPEDQPENNEAEVAVLNERLASLESNNAELQDRNAYLESGTYKARLVQTFLDGMNADTYFTLGAKLGYLEESAPDDEQPKGEARNGVFSLDDSGTQVQISEDEPEDRTGWERSDLLDCWVKVGP